jgi:hypothetical protein
VTEEGTDDGILLHVGTNDVSGRGGWSKVKLVRETEELVKEAIVKFGVGRVALSGILYRNDMDSSLVDGMNDFLCRLCERLGVVFVEGNRWMMEEEKARDGVHLTKRSAKVLGELLERVGDSMFRRPNERRA